MPWHTSHRKAALPADWTTRRQRIKQRAGGICEWRDHSGTRCTTTGTDCHHVGRNDNHDDSNLMWICRPHHDRETNRQAKAAQHAMYVTARKRTPEAHPGLMN